MNEICIFYKVSICTKHSKLLSRFFSRTVLYVISPDFFLLYWINKWYASWVIDRLSHRILRWLSPFGLVWKSEFQGVSQAIFKNLGSIEMRICDNFYLKIKNFTKEDPGGIGKERIEYTLLITCVVINYEMPCLFKCILVF